MVQTFGSGKDCRMRDADIWTPIAARLILPIDGGKLFRALGSLLYRGPAVTPRDGWNRTLWLVGKR